MADDDGMISVLGRDGMWYVAPKDRVSIEELNRYAKEKSREEQVKRYKARLQRVA